MSGRTECMGEVIASADAEEASGVLIKHSGLVGSGGAAVFLAPVQPGTKETWVLLPRRCRLDIAECIVGFIAGSPDSFTRNPPRSARETIRHTSVVVSWSDQSKVYGPGQQWLDQATGMAWWMHSRLTISVDRTGGKHYVELHTDGGKGNPEEQFVVPFDVEGAPLYLFVYVFREQESDDEDGEHSELAPELTVIQ